MLPGLTFIIVLLIGLMVGVGIGFAILWSIWLVLRWTIWKNALLPGDPVDIPARPETTASGETESTSSTG